MLSLLIIVLAVDAILKVWFKGFYSWRALFESWAVFEPLGFRKKVQRFVGKVLTCPICLPFYITALLLILRALIPFSDVVLFFLAVAGASSRLNELFG